MPNLPSISGLLRIRKKDMNWSNLKQNRCPKCNADLADKLEGTMFKCSCGFMISSRRFKEIISRSFKYEKPYRPEDENPEY